MFLLTFAILAVLKLVGVIGWSWGVVCIPLYLILALYAIAGTLYAVAGIVVTSAWLKS